MDTDDQKVNDLIQQAYGAAQPWNLTPYLTLSVKDEQMHLDAPDSPSEHIALSADIWANIQACYPYIDQLIQRHTEEEVKFQLGDVYLSYSVDNGRVLIHLRKQLNDTWYPSPEGVTLQIPAWRKLQELTAAITTALIDNILYGVYTLYMDTYMAHLSPRIRAVRVQRCEGCQLGSLSQTHHECLEMELDLPVIKEAIQEVDETQVIEEFKAKTQPRIPDLYVSTFLTVHSQDKEKEGFIQECLNYLVLGPDGLP